MRAKILDHRKHVEPARLEWEEASAMMQHDTQNMEEWGNKAKEAQDASAPAWSTSAPCGSLAALRIVEKKKKNRVGRTRCASSRASSAAVIAP